MESIIRPTSTAKAVMVALIMTAMLFRCVSAESSVNHTVGGATGWDLSSNITAWTASQSFFVNDSLVFYYGPNHDVIEVNGADFAKCRMASPIAVYDDGETVVPLLQPGRRFFICGRNNYCNMGLNMQIQIQYRTQMGQPSPFSQSPPSGDTEADDSARRRRHPPPPSPPFKHAPPPPFDVRPAPPPPPHDGDGGEIGDGGDGGGVGNGGGNSPAPSSGTRSLPLFLSVALPAVIFAFGVSECGLVAGL